MPVIGINIKEIDAKRFEDVVGPVRVNNNSNLKDVREQDMPPLNKKGLAIPFEFKSEYISDKSKKLAEIRMGGEVLAIDANHDKIIKDWKKDKKLPEELNLEIINVILRKCMTKALALSEELNLPPPIAIPFASKRKEEESKYIG